MKLGPLQKAWVAALRAHPERQIKGRLGRGTPTNYQACCLGELHLCHHRLKHERLPFNENGRIIDQLNNASAVGTLVYSFEKYGLRGNSAPLKSKTLNGNKSLVDANDQGETWDKIADFIEKYPEEVFAKSV